MAEPISLDAFRQKKAQEIQEDRITCRLVWLHCPTCNSLEYTEILAPNGRSHNCGTQVKEVEVELDARAEATITLHNLALIQEKLAETSKSRLKKIAIKGLHKVMSQLQASEEMYLNRLEAAAGQRLEPYEGSWEELAAKLPIHETNALGFAVSLFRYEPMSRF